ncbi:MAG: HAMP domain-containing histidine kinase [Clostridia bacterium]|nr:HAMP domain-containing histidine kinase [Clostridia bacterium]
MTEDVKNHEEVEETLREIRLEQERKKKNGFWRKVGRFFSAPFRLIGTLFSAVKSKIRIPVTVKTTIIFTILFTLALIALDIFIISSVQNELVAQGVNDTEFISSLTVWSIVLIAIAVTVVACVGGLASMSLLAPVRKMIRQIDDIDPSDLSQRIDCVDSQDELRTLTEQINEMLDEIEQAFIRQNKFVSDASHELKTPIAVIKGYANLLQRWGKDDKEILKESVDNIASETDNMQRIIEQLLTLAKMEKHILSEEKFNLFEQITQILDGYAVVNPQRKITLNCPQKLTIKTDKCALNELLRAVIDNAIKYSPEESEVTVTCTSENGVVSMSITDRGQGISPEDLPKIFDRFYRCDKSRGREKNSAGLGLSVAKLLATLLGGDIVVESALGVGSTFTVTIPQA